MSFLKKLQKSTLGIDIDDSTIKIAELSKSHFSSKVRINKLKSLNLPENIIKNGEIINRKILKKLLIDFLKQSKFKSHNVITVLPETKSFITVLDIPQNEIDGILKMDISKKAKNLIENSIPFSVEDIYFDIQKIDINKKNFVLFGASEKHTVDSYWEILTEIDLLPKAFEIESVAISRSVLNLKKQYKKAQIIIDIGKTHTTLLIYDNNTIRLSLNIPICGDSMNQEIMKKLNIDKKQAEIEKLKCGNGEKKCKLKVKKIIIGEIEKIAYKVLMTIDYYKKNFKHTNPIENIFLTGHVSSFKNIDKYLTDYIIKASKYSKNTKIVKAKPSFKIKVTNSDYAIYATAIGLALKFFPESYD